jgi:hypothetical protein
MLYKWVDRARVFLFEEVILIGLNKNSFEVNLLGIITRN